jgi:hypothetical protein
MEQDLPQSGDEGPMSSAPNEVERVQGVLRSFGIEVDEKTAAVLAEEDRARSETVRQLFDRDLATVDSAVELTRRGRR